MNSLLIIKPSSLGDVVHTLPAVASLRAAFPAARITWLVNPEWAPLIAGNPDVDEVYLFPRGEFRGLPALPRIARWAARTRSLRPDLALDFQGLLRSALIGRVSRPRRLLGLSDAREGARFFYQDVAPVRPEMHAIERYLELAKKAGAAIETPLRFPLPAGEPVDAFNAVVEPFVLLHPFARGADKSLAPETCHDLCRRLAPARVVLVGRRAEPFTGPENCLNLLNQTTLLQLIWLIRHARFVVSADSGPMHIAAAVTDRLVSIHTWSDPRLVGPYNRAAWIWKGGSLRQVCDLPDQPPSALARPFTSDDLGGVVQLVRQSVAG